ncbi:MAG TPA: hypothetical protein VHG91_19015 [Longimicrobium sp.]|nr:hypothetical protein [Longimicrobium sp.]
MKSVFRTLVLVPLALAAFALPAAAQQAQPQALVVTAQNRTAAADAAKGAQRRDDRARPGDVIRYRLTFTNVAGRPLRGVVLSNPLPGGMRFVAGSVSATRADARPEYSTDGGRTFSAQPTEEVTVDGRRVVRPAPPERYTHVRWTVGGTVEQGATVVAEFEARVGTPSPQGRTATPAAGTNGR